MSREFRYEQMLGIRRSLDHSVGFFAKPIETLVDKRVLGLGDQGRQSDRATQVENEATHASTYSTLADRIRTSTNLRTTPNVTLELRVFPQEEAPSQTHAKAAVGGMACHRP